MPIKRDAKHWVKLIPTLDQLTWARRQIRFKFDPGPGAPPFPPFFHFWKREGEGGKGREGKERGHLKNLSTIVGPVLHEGDPDSKLGM